MEVLDQLVGVAGVPSKVTVLVPCKAWKFVPAIVTDAPTAPEFGDRLLMLGVDNTVKEMPFEGQPATLTITFPVVAPLGTGTTIEVALQLVGAPTTPLKLTVLVL
jgi:hypothetical protein